MCSAGSPPPPPPPPVQPERNVVDQSVKDARSKERKRLARVAGRDSTILTPGLANTTANISKKTLLGS